MTSLKVIALSCFLLATVHAFNTECVKQLVVLGEDVARVVVDVQTKNLPALLKDVPTTVTQFNYAKTVCTNSTEGLYLADPQACLADVEKLVTLFQQVTQHVQDHDLQALLADFQAVQALVQQAQTDCHFGLTSTSEILEVSEECTNAVVQIKTDVDRFATDVQSVHPVAALRDIVTAIRSLEQAQEVCTHEAEVCANDIADLSQIFADTLTHAKKFDISSLIDDVASAKAKVNQTLDDCHVPHAQISRRVLTQQNDTQCVDEIVKFGSEINKLIFDLQKHNNVALLGDLSAVYKELFVVTDVCTKKQQTSRLLQEATGNIDNCIADLQSLAGHIQSVYSRLLSLDDVDQLFKDIAQTPALVK